MFQTTRRRLALWYTTVTAILLLLFASGVYLYVRRTLVERIDDTLHHVVEVVQRSLVIEPVNPHYEGGPLRINVEVSFRNNAATDEDDHIDIEWFGPTGNLLWSTLLEPLNVPLHPNTSGETVRVERGVEEWGDGEMGRWGDGEDKEAGKRKDQSLTLAPRASRLAPLNPPLLLLRQVTQRVEIGRQVLGYLRVSHPWFEVTKPSRQLFFDLSVGTGLMIGTVGAIGWFLSDLAMEPVRESYQRLKQFTSDASHELRNPIAVIQTNVQVALADPNPDSQIQRQHLQVVERLTRRLGRLVDDLLFLARQDSGMVQPQRSSVALDALLNEVIEEQQTLAVEKEIQISLNLLKPNSIGETEHSITFLPASAPSLGSEPPPSAAQIVPREHWSRIQADPDQLARLFTNLVSNAVQYTPSNGALHLTLQQIGRPGNYSLQVMIRDTGVGIPADALPHLFDRFYRVDPARSQSAVAGSGLGLAIANAIVENHHGQIQIDSTVNVGTTVTVILPQKE